MMDAKQAGSLRAPFPADTIGKLPRVTCKACSDSSQRHCGQHQRTQCPTCKNFISTAHIHLDYVGHAATTDRLLQVDPGWTWEPVAFDTSGLPARDRDGGLWIRLTVAGTCRYGYGDGKSVKECIGDAIRNAAMRFGVALDLWAKEDLRVEREPEPDVPLPVVTDPAWQKDLELRIDKAVDVAELRDLYAEVAHEGNAGRVEADHVRVLQEEIAAAVAGIAGQDTGQ